MTFSSTKQIIWCNLCQAKHEKNLIDGAFGIINGCKPFKYKVPNWFKKLMWEEYKIDKTKLIKFLKKRYETNYKHLLLNKDPYYIGIDHCLIQTIQLLEIWDESFEKD